MNEHVSTACVQWLNASRREPPTESELRKLKQGQCRHVGVNLRAHACPDCGMTRADILMSRYL